MLPDATLSLPASLAAVLAWFAPLFTASSFRTFSMLACGFIAQTGKRTVCGMLAGAGLPRLWSHDRAHSFVARPRWNLDELGLVSSTSVNAGSAGGNSDASSHHSCARIEADIRGLGAEYCDMTTEPDGDYVRPAERLVEIRGRTGPITR
jgi:hypothetical protein